jgi:hypothetical protein
MSVFGNIISKIFPANHPAVVATAHPDAPTSQPAPIQGAPEVDVEAVLNGLAKQRKDQLNWRNSIVDLMKLLGMDSSIEARKTLARELHYTGDMKDSATMNIWLHKQVMQKVADNGGTVPSDLKH